MKFPWKKRISSRYPDSAAFVVFEGIDGSGKSTQALRLANVLTSLGIDSILTSEPSDGPMGLYIRSMTERPDPEEEVRLFSEDRRRHVENVIEPNLRNGRVVICDRYVYSSVAYQGARGVDVRHIMEANRPFCIQPDLIVFIDVPVDDALERIRLQRGGDVTPFEKAEELEAVAEIYRDIDDPLTIVIDGSRNADDIHVECLRVLSDLENMSSLRQILGRKPDGPENTSL